MNTDTVIRVIAALSATLVVGCSDVTTRAVSGADAGMSGDATARTDVPADRTSRFPQASVPRPGMYPETPIGGGIDSRPGARAERPTGETCVSGTADFQHRWLSKQNAFWVERPDDIAAAVRSQVAPNRALDPALVDDIEAAIGARFEEADAADVYTVVGYFETGREYLNHDTESAIEGVCEGAEPPASLSAFVDRCGDRYVHGVTYGGVLVLTYRFGNRRAPADRLAHRRRLAPIDHPDEPERLRTEVIGQLPTPAEERFADGVTAKDWLSYIERVNDTEPIRSVVGQKLARYRRSDFDACGIESDRDAACYVESVAQIRKLLDPRGRRGRSIARARWLLDHPKRFTFPLMDRDEALADVREAVDRYDRCTEGTGPEALATTLDRCTSALAEGAVDRLCEACEPSDVCSIDLKRMIADLPEATFQPE